MTHSVENGQLIVSISKQNFITIIKQVDVEKWITKTVKNSISIKPNPINDELHITITLANEVKYSLLISDNLGRVIACQSGTQQSGTFIVHWNPTLSTGIYTLILCTGSTVNTSSFIVIR